MFAQLVLDFLTNQEEKNHTLEVKEIAGQQVKVKVYKETKQRPRNYMKSKPTRNVKRG
jgi:poly(A) polymerase Pap1